MSRTLSEGIIAVRSEMKRLHSEIEKRDMEIEMLKTVIRELKDSNLRLLSENHYLKEQTAVEA